MSELRSGSASQEKNYESQSTNVNGVRIHYLKAGTGKKLLVLVHGFGDTSRMWIPLFDEFCKDYTIIAPDLRGLGDSSRPPTGYDKTTVANDVRELVKRLGHRKIDLVGHEQSPSDGPYAAHGPHCQYHQGVRSVRRPREAA